MDRLVGTISSLPGRINGTISTTSNLLIGYINKGGSSDIYRGEYEVTPKAAEAVILDTKYKTMIDDVTVKKVPYFEVHNDNGKTAYIAMEV